MYAITNTVINNSRIGLYCAYSTKPEEGETYDAWRVSVLNPGMMSSSTDIDYIKPTSGGWLLCWGGTNGGVVPSTWMNADWVKIRQLVTTEIIGVSEQPGRGY